MGLSDLKLEIEIRVKIKPMRLTFKEDPKETGPNQFERNQDLLIRKKEVRWAGDKDLLEDWVGQAMDCIAKQEPTIPNQSPTINIGEITDISATGATINAKINPHSVSTQFTANYHINRGEIEGDGDAEDAAESPLSDNAFAAAGAVLTGLTPNTRYYVRWRAKTAAVQKWSELQSFKTLES